MSKPYKIPKGRLKLAYVLRSTGTFVRISDVEKTLNISRSDASKQLSRWVSQGLMRRTGPGIYTAARIDRLDGEQVLHDPWALVPELFSPAYIGGRTITEHWDLSEQIFLDTSVVTGRPVRSKHQKSAGWSYTLKQIHPDKIFGLDCVWYEDIKIAISDLPRTILDLLGDPVFGGGTQHVIDCFGEYLRHDCRQDETLISYAERFGNGAIFKRLGFLSELMSDSTYLVDACKKRITKGNTKLSPDVPCTRLVTRWRLWIPERDFRYEPDRF